MSGLSRAAECSHWDDETSVWAATDAGPNETSATAAAAAAVAVEKAEDSILAAVQRYHWDKGRVGARRGEARRGEARWTRRLFVELQEVWAR